MFTEMKMQKFKLKYVKEVCLIEVVEMHYINTNLNKNTFWHWWKLILSAFS